MKIELTEKLYWLQQVKKKIGYYRKLENPYYDVKLNQLRLIKDSLQNEHVGTIEIDEKEFDLIIK